MKNEIMLTSIAMRQSRAVRCAFLLVLCVLFTVSSPCATINYQIVVEQGDAAPGTPGSFTGFENVPGINNQGQVVFGATVMNITTEGLWAGAPGNLALVALEDGGAPGLPGVQFDSFADDEPGLMLADDGRVAFAAALKGTGVVSSNNLAMYVGLPGAIQLLMREGSPAPGTATNLFIEPSSTLSPSFYSFLLRENGLVAFGARLNGVATVGNNQEGLWGEPPVLCNLSRGPDNPPRTESSPGWNQRRSDCARMGRCISEDPQALA